MGHFDPYSELLRRKRSGIWKRRDRGLSTVVQYSKTKLKKKKKNSRIAELQAIKSEQGQIDPECSRWWKNPLHNPFQIIERTRELSTEFVERQIDYNIIMCTLWETGNSKRVGSLQSHISPMRWTRYFIRVETTKL